MAELISTPKSLVLKVHDSDFDKLDKAMDSCFLKKGDPLLEMGKIGEYFVLTIENTENTRLYMNKLIRLINEA